MAFNMDPKKCPMPTQDPNVRNKNFKEVALGYTAEMAVNEAKRCIGCKNKPCQSGCPVGIDIPEFIAHVAEGDFEAAYQVINRSSSLPAVCGRVCPQESQSRASAPAASRMSPSASAVWSASWPTGTVKMSTLPPSCLSPTATRSPSSAQALPA